MIHWDFNMINNCVFCTCWLLRLMTNILGFPALSTSPSYLVQTEDSFLIPSPATSNLFMYGLCYVPYEVQCIHPYQRPIYVWLMLCSICSTVYPSVLATYICMVYVMFYMQYSVSIPTSDLYMVNVMFYISKMCRRPQ